MDTIALVGTTLEIPGGEHRHGRQHAWQYRGRIQSERGNSKPDAPGRRKVSHPHENRHSESTTRRRRTCQAKLALGIDSRIQLSAETWEGGNEAFQDRSSARGG